MGSQRVPPSYPVDVINARPLAPLRGPLCPLLGSCCYSIIHWFGASGSRYNLAQEVVGLDERRNGPLVVGSQLGEPAKYVLNVDGFWAVGELRCRHRVLRTGETPGGSPRRQGIRQRASRLKRSHGYDDARRFLTALPRTRRSSSLLPPQMPLS